MPIYTLKCMKCGEESEMILDEYLPHNEILLCDDACECGGKRFQRSRPTELTADQTRQWERSCK